MPHDSYKHSHKHKLNCSFQNETEDEPITSSNLCLKGSIFPQSRQTHPENEKTRNRGYLEPGMVGRSPRAKRDKGPFSSVLLFIGLLLVLSFP